MRLNIVEHKRELLVELKIGDEDNSTFYNRCLEITPRTFINRGNEIPYYKIHVSTNRIEIEADYYVGADWVINNEKFVYVAPKINTKLIERFEQEIEKTIQLNNQIDIPPDYCPKQLNYLKMYLDAAANPVVSKHIQELLFIDWNSPEIKLDKQENDLLTPFLVVNYLNHLKQIVRKGLKKSYYIEKNNLQSRVKGKILVGENLKTNILKNKLTNTVCQYQEFGINGAENRFLKKVLLFVSSYIANNEVLFRGNEVIIKQMLGYCNSAFESVSNECNEYELKNIKLNAFFKEYQDAIKMGKLLMKRFSYNFANTQQNQIVSTPPFWIDMPRLFELYVFQLLIESNSSRTSDIIYQFGTYGNYLDFLVKDGTNSMIIDAKYKLQYENGKVHDDMRQVSGYARLNAVLDEVASKNNNFSRDVLLPCLIIYPNPMNDEITSLKLEKLIDDSHKINAYHQIYKLGIPLPIIS